MYEGRKRQDRHLSVFKQRVFSHCGLSAQLLSSDVEHLPEAFIVQRSPGIAFQPVFAPDLICPKSLEEALQVRHR